MKISTKYFNATYIALFILIIWDALKVYLSLHHPIIQFIVLFPAVIIGFADNSKNILKASLFSPNKIWLIWIVYALLNTFIINDYQHHRGQNPFVFISSVIFPFFFLIFIVANKRSTYELLRIIIFAYFFRLLLSFLFDNMMTIGNDEIERFGSEFNANSIGLGALFIVIMIGIKKIQFGKVSKWDFFFIGLAIITILLTSSKKTFLSLMAFVIGLMYITRSKNTIKNAIRYLFFGMVIFIGFIYTINSTNIGQRLTQTFYNTIEADRPEQMFDHRANQYIVGWHIFKTNPVNGVGLAGYVVESGYSTPLHTEYMIQLAETGVIGAFLFLLFYFTIFRRLFKLRNKIPPYKKIAEIYILAVVILLSLLLGTWQYNNLKNWVLIALAVRFIYENRKTIVNSYQ